MIIKNRFYIGLVIILLLLIYGVIRFPSSLESPLGLIADGILVLGYGLLFRFWIPVLESRQPEVFRIGTWAGLLIGLIFVVEIVLEYILLPENNSTMGLIEYGSVLALFTLIGIGLVYRSNRLRSGVNASIFSALIGSLIWIIAVLSIFHLFHGTTQQTAVFRAEGNFEDFASSGSTDFDAFIMQDFWGAIFFHSILLPVFSIIFGFTGGLIGKSLVWIRDVLRKNSKEVT